MNPTIDSLRDAINRHDPEAMAALFAPEYRNEQPLHPARGFSGRDQVSANWTQMFAGVPDLQAGIVRETIEGSRSWTEWVWRGSHRDGTPFRMRGSP